MNGLFMMDWKILLKMKKNFLIFLALTILYLTGAMVEFAISFSVIFVLGILIRMFTSQVEGPSAKFIHSLPFSRKNFVTEKFIFGLVLSMVFPTLIVLIEVLTGQWTAPQAGESLLISLVLSLFILDLLLPCSIRFGQNAQITITMICFAILILTGLGIQLITPALAGLTAFIQSISPVILWGAVVAVMTALTILSFWLSVRWLEQKEF